MHVGLGVLRLPPAAFWNATPHELAAAFDAAHAPTFLRPDLDDLMSRFPDEP